MSAARDIRGPWLSTEALSRTPPVHREFDLNRDPLAARQVLDQGKSEKQRRDESGKRGYFIPRKKEDKPAPELKPPRHMRGDADKEGWLLAQRDAAFARAAGANARSTATRERESPPTRSGEQRHNDSNAPSR